MKPCMKWEAFFRNYREIDTDRVAFDEHLRDCPECRRAVSAWDALLREIQLMSSEELADQPGWSPSVKESLISRARERELRSTRTPALRLSIAVAALAIFLGCVVYVFAVKKQDSTDEKSDVQLRVAERIISAVGAENPITSFRPGDSMVAPAQGRLLIRIGEDEVGLAQTGELTLIEATPKRVRLLLKKGEVACRVSPREGVSTFVIEAGPVVVRVVGTRFMVSRTGDEVRVVVAEGRVAVKSNEWNGLIAKGEGVDLRANGEVARVILDDAAIRKLDKLLGETYVNDAGLQKAKETASQVRESDPGPTGDPVQRPQTQRSLKKWRRWVIDGRYAEAEKALVAYLRKAPQDIDAWWLLADSRRKSGNWDGAVEVYRRIVGQAPPNRANMARFRAGAILQDKLGRQGEASRMFKEYLRAEAVGKTLEAEAMVRLGASLAALGRKGEAVALLEEVVDRYGGSSAAGKARQMLDDISHKSRGLSHEK